MAWAHRVDKFYVKRLSEKAKLPVRGSELAAGWDLSSAADMVVPANGKAIVPTDLAIAIPEDCYARIAPRSGLAAKHSIDTGAGVVDADYRGPVGVILFNHGPQDFEIKQGDRIAQLILEKVRLDVPLKEIDDLPETARGAAGFGSTGVSDEPLTKKPRAADAAPPEEDPLVALHAKYDDLLTRIQQLEEKGGSV